MDPRQKLQAVLAKIDALEAQLSGGTPTDEQTKTMDALLAEGEALKGEIAAADAAAARAKRAASLRAGVGANAGGRQIAPGAGGGGTPGPTAHDPIRVRENVLDDPKLGFKSFAAFALAIRDAGPNLGGIEASEQLRPVLAAAAEGMSAGVTADGGVLVPPAFSRQIWDGARQKSDSMLQYCDVQPIDPGVESVTIPAIAETSRANGSRWGGVQGAWKDELTQMGTLSKVKLRDVKISPHELYCFGFVSDKLLRQAPGLASNMLLGAFADEINFKIGDAIFNGNGVSKPRGFIGHPASVSVAKEVGQVAGTIVKENIDKMWARCHALWRNSAVWFVNQGAEPELEKMTMVVGTGGVPVYLPAGGVADTPNARLKGRPVIVCEYAAAKGTKGDLSLVNLGAFLVGLRGLVDQAQSMHLKFDYAQTAFRAIYEVDGQPWLAAPITPYKGADTLSPFVTLDDRS